MTTFNPKQLMQWNKIALLNELNSDIERLANEKGWTLSASYSETLPSAEEGIDPNAAHASIQAKMENAERNFAALTEEILSADEKHINDLKNAAYLFGYRYSRETAGADSAYALLSEVLLDGMPCDNVNVVSRADENEAVWSITEDVHSSYWKNAAYYETLRAEVIRGLLSKSGMSYEKNGSRAVITKTAEML